MYIRPNYPYTGNKLRGWKDITATPVRNLRHYAKVSMMVPLPHLLTALNRTVRLYICPIWTVYPNRKFTTLYYTDVNVSRSVKFDKFYRRNSREPVISLINDSH